MLIQEPIVSEIDQLLFDISGDSTSNPTRSALALRIRDREIDASHTLHEEIDKRRPSFSHWNNALFFSLPAGAPNDATTQITVRFPVRVNTWLVALLLLSTGLQAYRLHGHELTPRVGMVLQLPAALLMGVGYAGLAFAAIYLLSVIVGLLIGAALPTTVLIKWSAMAAAAAGASLNCLMSFSHFACWALQLPGTKPVPITASRPSHRIFGQRAMVRPRADSPQFDPYPTCVK
jgi:hypothetical protein